MDSGIVNPVKQLIVFSLSALPFAGCFGATEKEAAPRALEPGAKAYIYLGGPKAYTADPALHSHDPTVRDRLVALSREGGMTPYQLHPDFPGYPAGETGAWSEHAGFACLGIPVTGVEATNFAINGKDGYDGYSRTVNPALGDCYDANTTSARDCGTETKWGNIWHTGFDRLGELQRVFPCRVQRQIGNGTDVLVKFLHNPGL